MSALKDEESGSVIWDLAVDIYESLCNHGFLGLYLVPVLYLLAFGSYRLTVLCRGHNSHGNTTMGTPYMFYTKLVLYVLVGACQVTDLVTAALELIRDPPVMYYYVLIPTLLSITLMMALVILLLENNHHHRSSNCLAMFWMLVAIFAIPPTIDLSVKSRQGSFSTGFEHVHFYSNMFFYGLAVVTFLLSIVAEPEGAYKRIDQDENLCPEEDAGFLSQITFGWMSALILQGWKSPITADDLWALGRENTAEAASNIFNKYWNQELQKARPSVVRALVKGFGGPYMLAAIFKGTQDILAFLSPQILKLLIQFTKDDTQPTWKGYLYAALLLAIAVMQSIVLHQYFHRCFTTGMRLRSAIITAIYQKSLVLSNAARKNSTQGEITNLMAVDAQRFQDLTTYLHIVWSGPFQIVLALYFLYDCMGPSIFAGLGVMVFLIPMNTLGARVMKKLQKAQMKVKDDRMVVVNEALGGMRVIKLYAWEKSFLSKLMDARDKELKVLRTSQYVNAFLGVVWTTSPFLVSLASFTAYVLQGHVLTAEKAFVALALFNLLQFPIAMLPMLIGSLVEAYVAVGRITRFLTAGEVDPEAVIRTTRREDCPENEWGLVEIQQATFTWDSDASPVLADMNVCCRPSTLTAVVGRVGSGKSSLCAALLGNLEKLSGTVKANGSFAYVPQQAWIQNATVRDNILFGKAYSDRHYQRVVDACALRPDLAMLPAGDMTEIGEKGINLSGGQKQRISLARAVYQNADIYIFDDPLSAVDAHVARHIFDNVLGPTGMIRDKTRILSTHRIDILPKCDNILVLKAGRISEQGTYEKLKQAGEEFAGFLNEYMVEEDETAQQNGQMERKTSLNGVGRKLSLETTSEEPAEAPLKKSFKDGKETGKLMGDEVMETGGVKMTNVTQYLSAVGWPLVIIITLLYVAGQATQILTNVWLSVWSTASASDPQGTNDHVGYYLGVYAVFGMGNGLTVLIVNLVLSVGSIKASRQLHNRMIGCVMRSPMAFFDTTPMGRIVNRFSKDIYTVDEAIPNSLKAFLGTFFRVLGIVVVIGFSTPLFLAVIVPLFGFYLAMQRYYVSTSRQLKRLDGTTRSPIFSHFGETLNGVATIRAYDQQQRFIEHNEATIDTNCMAYYPSIASNRWLAVRLETIGNLMVFFAALFAVLSRHSISAATVGLSVSYALSVTQSLNWIVRMTSELETNIVSVERVVEYSNIPSEAPTIVPTNRPALAWPQYGAVDFTDYSARYREGLDLVVRNITCHIKAGERVGIVGRTGAGKSSLTLCLFRIIEGATGSILIDNVDIAKLGLEDLRSRLTVIPQDPVLFSGTIRSNLDPFGQYDDQRLWATLELCHLADYVRSQDMRLDAPVSENGENLSVGQRQLVCLGRALLRKTKILVLDEATAAVDLETDQLIQDTIRQEFSDCTILTIAHRLNTIMNSDRVMVLSSGRIVEFDSPKTLLRRPDSQFYGMAKEARLLPSPSGANLVDLDAST